ncbi:ankyrin, partial [Thozetella sp. PMI_491]
MRLLHTQDHSLRDFGADEIPIYAILSHRWGTQEISCKDVPNIERGEGPGYEKVRKFCSIARSQGFDYAWIDTCCIEKTSSAELSEAINSMYRWYQDSTVCYAYLADVSANDVGLAEFSESNWFTRGWTLQELIGPSMLIFLNQDWHEIGTKLSLQPTISRITNIPKAILQGSDLEWASIAQRMSWASRRKTTRVEDVAYSLMGIFGVNMPMLYGEGDKAFHRLQEEIMKISDDHSLFAWQAIDCDGGLLAPSPAAFLMSSDIVPVHSLSSLSGVITRDNKGIRLSVRFMDIDRSPSQRVQLAILPCVCHSNIQKSVAIYVRALTENKEYFARTSSNKMETVLIGQSSQPQFKPESICVQGKRKTHATNSQNILEAAAGYGCAAAVEHLLQEATTISCQRLLEEASRHGNKEVIKLLLEIDGSCHLALSIAVEHGHEIVVKLLLEKGAVVDQHMLREASRNGNEAVVKLLLDKGAVADQEALLEASWNENEAVVKLLLEKGAVADQEALREASRNGNEAVVKLLLEKGAVADQEALLEASRNGNEAVVKLLLDKGAVADREALLEAFRNGNEAVVKLLLDK